MARKAKAETFEERWSREINARADAVTAAQVTEGIIAEVRSQVMRDAKSRENDSILKPMDEVEIAAKIADDLLVLYRSISFGIRDAEKKAEADASPDAAGFDRAGIVDVVFHEVEKRICRYIDLTILAGAVDEARRDFRAVAREKWGVGKD